MVDGVPHIITDPHLGGPTVLKYSGAFSVSNNSFPLVQFIGLQYYVI